MALTIEQWHQRYLQQSRWTKDIRRYLYQKCDIQHAHKILDVGCGTGVLEQEFTAYTTAELHGVDINHDTLGFAREFCPSASYTAGNCLSLPYPKGTFDVAMCHFLLLWLERKADGVREMMRVTRPGGAILALAEPDYGGRIDYPDKLAQVGTWQTESLIKQGADPFTGRQLRGLFSAAGLLDIEVGVLGGQWKSEYSPAEFDMELQVTRSDLADDQVFNLYADQFEELERSSRVTQQRILYVPVFYAVGIVGK